MTLLLKGELPMLCIGSRGFLFQHMGLMNCEFSHNSWGRGPTCKLGRKSLLLRALLETLMYNVMLLYYMYIYSIYAFITHVHHKILLTFHAREQSCANK